MRVSVDKNDKAYSNENYFNTGVKLDGNVLTHCITADTDEGMVVCFALDENGRVIRAEEELKKETLYGVVEIFEINEG